MSSTDPAAELAALEEEWSSQTKGRYKRLAVRGGIILIIFGFLATQEPWGKWLLIGYAALILLGLAAYVRHDRIINQRREELQQSIKGASGGTL